ncbi:hypothetical protein VPBG_00018 [Vibrio phage helene 12B3]|uniref:hypothetical protein n=1 Tax=Vibrio phage helene 12B3 TaxID=573173 RepID=UPI0002C0DA04|nr:hypothetical protein VPBG_00018 [Vibrio phage helene 12B3]AGG57791.1 hypothetical protein VPBG_00018 [Vibrio phage helene 12B3]
MTEQKLRKFKLIDREGFLANHGSNKFRVAEHLVNGVFTGVVDEDQCLVDVKGRSGDIFILESEFHFFEEVFGDVEEVFIPTLNEVYEVSRADDLETWYKFIPRAKYIPHYLAEEHYVGDWQSEDVSWKVEQISAENFIFRSIKEKTWQEKLCEEFDVEGKGFRNCSYEKTRRSV